MLPVGDRTERHGTAVGVLAAGAGARAAAHPGGGGSVSDHRHAHAAGQSWEAAPRRWRAADATSIAHDFMGPYREPLTLKVKTHFA